MKAYFTTAVGIVLITLFGVGYLGRYFMSTLEDSSVSSFFMSGLLPIVLILYCPIFLAIYLSEQNKQITKSRLLLTLNILLTVLIWIFVYSISPL